jgi:hypothetical protein
MTKRRQARKVATMVKRLKKNLEDGELQPPTEAGADLVSGDGWDAQQQATVTAYAQSRGRRLTGSEAGPQVGRKRLRRDTGIRKKD